ncbi:MAG: fibronectin type III domain-containing protein [Planctomycetes bacterium]|nr:fibronectin type III domain-containing protein [Planctomycetota bacterium]
MFKKTARLMLAGLLCCGGMAWFMDGSAQDITFLSTEFDVDSGPWIAADAAGIALDARPGWLRVTSFPGAFGSILVGGGLPVDLYPPPWHLEMSLERPTDVSTAIGFLTQSDGIQYLFNNFPGGTGPGGRTSFGFGALWPASTKGAFGLPNFNDPNLVPEAAMAGGAIELWIGVINNTTMRYGVRPAGTPDWNFAPDVAGYDLSADPVSFRSMKIMVENRQPWFNQWPGTTASLDNVIVDIDYIRFFSDVPPLLVNEPQKVMATAGDRQVALSWEAPTPVVGVTVTGYNVYLTQQGPEEKLNDFLWTSLQYTAQSLKAGTKYCFVVKAMGDNGLESNRSNVACATTPGLVVRTTEFDGDAGPWSAADFASIDLAARPGWLRITTPPGTLGTILVPGGIPVNAYPPPWHLEMRLERPTDVPTAIGILTESDGIQYLFNNLPGGTGPGGATSFGFGALWDAGKGAFGQPDFSGVPESAMAGGAIEIWVGLINNTTMRYGVRPAGSTTWNFAPDVVGYDLSAAPVSFASLKIMVENRQPWFDQWPGTTASLENVVVDLDYIRFVTPNSEFDGDAGSWTAGDSAGTGLAARPGWLRITTPPAAFGTINLSGGLPVDVYPPPWHLEMRLERPTDVPTAIGLLLPSDGIQYLFQNFPGGTGPGGRTSFGFGALWDAGKGIFGQPDFSGVPESALAGGAIELWVGVINNTTMRYGVRPAGSPDWNFAPDVAGGFDLSAAPASYGSIKIMVENRQGWFDQWPGTTASTGNVVVDLDYIRFKSDEPTPLVVNEPQNVTATAGDLQVELSWAAPAPVAGVTVAGYNVYRFQPGPEEKLTATPVTGLQYTAQGLQDGILYCFVVKAVRDNGLESKRSNEACATTLGEVVPTTEFDVDTGPWIPETLIDLAARPGWLRVTTPPRTFGTISIAGGLPVDVYYPPWHLEMRLERPTDVPTAVGLLAPSDGIQYLFTNLPGGTGPGGRTSLAAGALWDAGKGVFGQPDFSGVPEAAMAGGAIELWIGVINNTTMRFGVRPAGSTTWNFAPDVMGGFDLSAAPVSFGSLKIMVENRQGWFDQWPPTAASSESVVVDIDYVRFILDAPRPLVVNEPQKVTATERNCQVELSWDVPAPAAGVSVAGYNVFRTQPGPEEKLTAIPVTGLQYTVQGLQDGIFYCFVVRAVGDNGLPSKKSTEACAFVTCELLPRFRRGDVDPNDALDTSDAINILYYKFLGQFDPTCLDALDADDSGEIDQTDAIRILLYAFLGGDPLPAPFLTCGVDTTPDIEGQGIPPDLGCASYPACP